VEATKPEQKAALSKTRLFRQYRIADLSAREDRPRDRRAEVGHQFVAIV
jgi:hypothetical protein